MFFFNFKLYYFNTISLRNENYLSNINCLKKSKSKIIISQYFEILYLYNTKFYYQIPIPNDEY